MQSKLSLMTLAALSVIATAVPAAAQGGHRSFHEGWNRGSADQSWGGAWNAPAYDGRVGVGPSRWYDGGSYGAYAAEPYVRVPADRPYGYSDRYGYRSYWGDPGYSYDRGTDFFIGFGQGGR